MPRVNIINHPTIFSWEITESVNELNAMIELDAYEADLVKTRNRPHRKKELLVSRILLQEQIPNGHIHYTQKRPVLVNSEKEISISNSKNLVFIMLNPPKTNTGIDVQYYSETVVRVKNKFLHPLEKSLPSIDEMKTLNIIWSVKETLYKAYSEDKLEFKKQLVINDISLSKITGVILYPKRSIPFEVGLFQANDFVLSWFIK